MIEKLFQSDRQYILSIVIKGIEVWGLGITSWA